MTGSSAEAKEIHEDGSAGALGDELAVVLSSAVREAAQRLDAVTAGVYLLSADGAELRPALIGGSPPSVFTLPGRMPLDAPYASARALASRALTVLADPDPQAEPVRGTMAYPYIVASAPLVTGDHRFGTLTVLRCEDRGGYGDEDRATLQEIADRLLADLVDLVDRGRAIGPGRLPVLVPVFGAASSPGLGGDAPWGVAGVAGSAGLSLMYPLQRLADMLNGATSMDHVTGAAQFCVMAPFRARAMVLTSVREGRLWVIGHSGDSAHLVRELHGRGLHVRTPDVQAARGRALFLSGDTGGREARTGDRHDRTDAAAYLPLVGSRHVVDLPVAGTEHVVGVCCLSFSGSRLFSPEERAVLTMMAGLLGSAVERIELNTERQGLAEGIQKRLLPSTLTDLPRFTTTARYQPATATVEVGGDWYDVIRMPDDRVVLVIGDVEGHTVESAAVMGQLRSAVAAYATEGHGPTALLERTGRLLTQLGTDLIATCCVVCVDTDGSVAEVALAGHPAPLERLPDGTVRTLRAPANVPLGLAGSTPYSAREYTLTPGSVLLLYSDGLIGPRRDAAALLGAVGRDAGTNLEALADRLLDETPDPHGRRDDAALLLARYEGADTETAPRTGHLYIQRRDLRGVKEARGFVHDRLCGWGLTDMSDDLELITSEVVTNALIHAGSDVDIRLRAFEDRVRLEVRDSDSDPPVPTLYSLSEEGSSRAEHGRGLFLVDALATAWNTSPNGRGKTVWLEMDIPHA